MNQLNKDDIKTLDYLVKTCYEKEILNERDLEVPKSIGKPPTDANEERWISIQKREYYKPFFVILNEYNKLYDILNLDFAGSLVDAKSKNPNTKNFINSGGFKNLYNNQQESNMHQKLLREKDVNDALISKFTREKQKLTFWLAIISLFLSFIAIGISVYSVFNSQNPIP